MPGPCQRVVELKGDDDTNYSWCPNNGTQKTRKENGGIGDQI